MNSIDFGCGFVTLYVNKNASDSKYLCVTFLNRTEPARQARQ